MARRVETVWRVAHVEQAKATDRSGSVNFEASLSEQTVAKGGRIEAVVEIRIRRGSYVYGDILSQSPFTPLSIQATSESSSWLVHEPILPGTDEIEDGKPVYRDSLLARVPLSLASPEDGTFSLTIQLEFQVCNDLACLPPEQVVMQLPLLVRSTSLSHGE